MNFNHLLILIGTNPLPNYVVARYFLEKNKKLKKITAVYTRETFNIAERLETVLKKTYSSVEYCYCGLSDVGNSVKLRNEVTSTIDFDSGDVFHLNYTGGTKNMVVQTYLAVFDKTDFEKTSYSYLDAHDFKLKFDSGKLVTRDLRRDVIIPFEDLLFLHDCQKGKQGSQIDWSQSNNIIREFIQNDLIEEFISWKNRVIRDVFYTIDKLRKPDCVKLENLKPEHPFFKQAERLIASFPEAQAWKFDDKGCLIITDKRDDFKRGRGNFVQGILYLDGLWLEFYLRKLLESGAATEKLGFDILSNWHITRGKAEKDFEIDVMILNGYQLCGISITTSSGESLCKSKAFEIFHRTHQMGGDEARAILITALLPDIVRKISLDLEVDTGGQAQLKILGIDDLKPAHLWQTIKTYITGD